MKWEMTEAEAMRCGFTHEASYYGLPLYVCNISDDEVDLPVGLTTKYFLTDWVFTLFRFIEWLCTPPNKGIRLKIMRELGKEEDE